MVPEDDENSLARREKKRIRRSRSRDRGDRRRSRSRDRKRGKRSRSKERKFKIKEEELQQAAQWVGGDEDRQNGNQDYSNQDFEENIRVKEEKADAYAGYGGPGGGGVNMDHHGEDYGELEGDEGSWKLTCHLYDQKFENMVTVVGMCEMLGVSEVGMNILNIVLLELNWLGFVVYIGRVQRGGDCTQGDC